MREERRETFQEIKGSVVDTTGTHIFGYLNSISPASLKDYQAKVYRPTARNGEILAFASYPNFLSKP